LISKNFQETVLPQFISLKMPFTRQQFRSALEGFDEQAKNLHVQTEIPKPHPSQQETLILLVEDNPTNQIVAESYIQQLGYRVHVVANGAEAIEALSRLSYDLVFMDCQMPVMDGFEATKEIRLRENRQGRRTPIIAMTANAFETDREQCLMAGMDDFISKPFQLEDIAQIINKFALSKSSSQVDWAALAKLAQKTNAATVKKLIDSFLVTLPDCLIKLHEAQKENDAAKLAKTAHYLKASCGTLGAVALFKLCEEVENLANESSDPLKLSMLTNRLISQGQEAVGIYRNQKFYH
jgi:CheY-like chemotaxis protein